MHRPEWALGGEDITYNIAHYQGFRMKQFVRLASECLPRSLPGDSVAPWNIQAGIFFVPFRFSTFSFLWHEEN
jgi:hypothetical protein